MSSELRTQNPESATSEALADGVIAGWLLGSVTVLVIVVVFGGEDAIEYTAVWAFPGGWVGAFIGFSRARCQMRGGRAGTPRARWLWVISALFLLLVLVVAKQQTATRHTDLRHPIYSHRNVTAVRDLGFPIHPDIVNRPYTRDWAGHHAGAEHRSKWQTYRFETRASFDELVSWYWTEATRAGFIADEPIGMRGDLGVWHAKKWGGPGQPDLEITVNFFDGQRCVFYHVWPDSLP